MFQNKKLSEANAGSVATPWTDPALCRATSAEERMALFNNFRATAFRLETLDHYRVAKELPQFEAYLAGDASKNSCNKEWADYISKQTSQGKSIERIHIIPEPLTDYLRFELDWGYRYNQQAGEQIRLVYWDKLREIMPEFNVPDFWLFDDSQCLIQRYDSHGAWSGSELLQSASGVQLLLSIRDELGKISFPLNQHPHVTWQHGG